MKKNIGFIDRVVRFLSALLIVLLYLNNTINGTSAIVLLALSGVFIITGIIGVCPLYLPFKFSTRKNKN